MSKVIDTSQWIAFFTKAGLPPNVAANYALIFSDNRIQLDMLMDLSKEYLFDMGIKVMGDVIAILRFAKEFHTQLAKERVIGNTTPIITAAMKGGVAGRMVGYYTRPVTATEHRVSPTQVGKRLPEKSTIISLKRKSNDEPLVKKIRRVPPEEEGAYKIKMPLGITEKTRKILQQQQQQLMKGNNRRSVFARLGDSAVSSSTDSKNTSSVFERLGPSNKVPDDIPTSTVKEEKRKKGAPLEYQGVLKLTVANRRTVSTNLSKKGLVSTRTVIKPSHYSLPPITKTINIKRINNILQSSDKSSGISQNGNKLGSSQGIFGQSRLSQKSGVKSRLGSKIDARNLARTKILIKSNKRVPVKTTSNIFDRLGR